MSPIAIGIEVVPILTLLKRYDICGYIAPNNNPKARSQMAEAILRKKAGDYFNVYSAGTDPHGINPFTIKVMEEAGYVTTGQRSKHLNEYLGKVHMGIQIAVCSKAAEICPTFPGIGMKLTWPFDDPASITGSNDEKLAKFRSIRDQIETKIESWLQERNIETVQ